MDELLFVCTNILKRNSALLELQKMSYNEIVNMLREGDLDGMEL